MDDSAKPSKRITSYGSCSSRMKIGCILVCPSRIIFRKKRVVFDCMAHGSKRKVIDRFVFAVRLKIARFFSHISAVSSQSRCYLCGISNRLGLFNDFAIRSHKVLPSLRRGGPRYHVYRCGGICPMTAINIFRANGLASGFISIIGHNPMIP